MLATVQCTSSGMELEDYFQEELEAVQSKFSEEFSVSEGTDGCRLVQYRSMGDLVLTIQLHHGMRVMCDMVWMVEFETEAVEMSIVWSAV